MRRAAAALALLLVAPAGAHAETTTIAMPGKFFDPPRSTMVAGDVVQFRNNDLVTHDVLIGPFGSGPMARFTSWRQQIDQPGGYPFVCTLHAFMRGDLDVVAATLAAAPDGVLAGERLTLSGRTRAGTAHVGVEQSVSSRAWSAVGTGATPAPDGTFTTTVPAVEGASYRVTTPVGPSPVVTPRISARVDVHLHVERRGRHAIVHAHTMPSVTGVTATLELYSRWHFRWRARRHEKLDAHGRAAFRLTATPRRLARVVLRRTRRGPAVVHSGVVHLPAGRPARDPDSLLPGGAGSDGSAGHGGHAR
jgi:plastocyanin